MHPKAHSYSCIPEPCRNLAGYSERILLTPFYKLQHRVSDRFNRFVQDGTGNIIATVFPHSIINIHDIVCLSFLF